MPGKCYSPRFKLSTVLRRRQSNDPMKLPPMNDIAASAREVYKHVYRMAFSLAQGEQGCLQLRTGFKGVIRRTRFEEGG